MSIIDSKYYFLKYLCLFALLWAMPLYSQLDIGNSNNQAMYVDIVVFKSDSIDAKRRTLGRVDVYSIIPYQSLHFVTSEGTFAAKYDLVISVFDSLGLPVENKIVSRVVTSDDYFESQGSTGKFDFQQNIIFLPEGQYKVAVLLSDKLHTNNIELSRNIAVIDYGKYDFSVSGIMLLSSIEERNNGRYKITPHLSDDIGGLKEGFFIFWESYNYTKSDSLDFIFDVLDKDKVIYSGTRQRLYVGQEKKQNYMFVPNISKINTGSYILRLKALTPGPDPEPKDHEVLALAQRTLRYIETLSGMVINDLNTSIRQLAYIATNSELSYIESAEEESERRKRFEAFWKGKDPSPNTEINEAFVDFYSRVAYANKNFKSHMEGWRTDLGMVFIVFGEPQLRDRSYNNASGSNFEIWQYQRLNRQFIFQDRNGFGDYRLVQPMSVNEKYQYGR